MSELTFVLLLELATILLAWRSRGGGFTYLHED